jgi:hypothetical protein
MKVVLLWDIAPGNPDINRRYGESCHLLACWFLVRIIFDPEDESDRFFPEI